jgi:hypothetical protein
VLICMALSLERAGMKFWYAYVEGKSGSTIVLPATLHVYDVDLVQHVGGHDLVTHPALEYRGVRLKDRAINLQVMLGG